MLYNWYLQIETSRGERFSSAPMRLEVSKDLETEADHILIFGGDNIVCTIEDDVSLSDSGPAQNQLVFGNQEIVYNSELILY